MTKVEELCELAGKLTEQSKDAFARGKEVEGIFYLTKSVEVLQLAKQFRRMDNP